MPAVLTDPFFILLIGILIVVGGIIWFRMHAFLALLLGALVVALMTPDSAVEQYVLGTGATPEAARELAASSIGERVAVKFGATAGQIGILIAMASIIGKCLLESGAAERIVRSALKVSGASRAPLTFLGSSFFLGVPVFFDMVFYLMIPLAKAMAARIGKNYLLLVLVVAAGAAMANSLVPPTPGPLFLASEMQIPFIVMMTGGIIVGLFTIAAGYAYAVWANRRWPIPLRDSPDAPLKDIRSFALQDIQQLPLLWFSLLPVIIPLVFITAKASLDTMGISIALIQFLGEKNIALITGGLAALILLAVQRKGDKKKMTESMQTALLSGGTIILITAAGGAFGGMLQQTGISMRIAEMTKDFQMALIPLAFFVAAVVRTAQGSATVAMITSSGILAGMVSTARPETGGYLEYHQLYLGLAVACGSKLVPWMNDSGFWIVCKMSNLTEKEALKTFSPMLTVMGLAGLIVILIAARFLPLV